MQSKLKKSAKISEKPTYPYLGKSKTTGRVVLFVEPQNGLVIVMGTGTDPVGYCYNKWDESSFCRLKDNEVVELSN